MLCQYKDIFGKPREGVHACRIPVVDIAAVDFFGTALAALLISYSFGSTYSFSSVMIFLMILAVFLHALFCVPTKINTTIYNIYSYIINHEQQL